MLLQHQRLIDRHLRRTYRRASIAGDETTMGLIDQLWASGEGYFLFMEQCCDEAGVAEPDPLDVDLWGYVDITANELRFGMLDGLKDLLDWLTQNWSSIAEIIEYIISLFSEEPEEDA